MQINNVLGVMTLPWLILWTKSNVTESTMWQAFFRLVFSVVSRFFKNSLTDSGGFLYSAVTVSNVGDHLCSGTELHYRMMSCLNCIATGAILDCGSNSGNVVLSNMLLLKITSGQILLGWMFVEDPGIPC